MNFRSVDVMKYVLESKSHGCVVLYLIKLICCKILFRKDTKTFLDRLNAVYFFSHLIFVYLIIF